MTPSRCTKSYRASWDEIARCELVPRHRGACGPLPKPALAQEHSETSKAAARAVGPSRAASDRHLVETYIAERGGATDEEVQRGLRMDGNTERPRRVELVDAQRVVDSGRTRTTSSGKQATVWVAR